MSTITPLDPGTRLASLASGDEQIEALLERIHEIGPLLRENAPIADRDRRLPDSSIDAIESTGAFGISTDPKYGGYGGGARMLFEAARTLGYYCPASAWVTVISNGSVMLANRWPDSARERIYADGKPLRMASIFVSPQGSAIRDGAGYRIEGEWPFGSNILHSEWAIGIVPVRESVDVDPQIGFAIMKRGDYSVKDTWFTVGMRGTGSNTMVIEDLWIPEDQVVMFPRLMGTEFESNPDTTFGQRIAPQATMATTIAAPSVGAAQAALDFVAQKSHTRPITYSTYPNQAASGAFVKDIGAASMKIESAILHLRRSADTIDAYGAGLTPMPDVVRARGRGDIGHAVHELADAMNDLMWLHGTASFAESSPLSRLWRDVNTGTRHQTIAAPFNYEIHGNGLLGVPYVATMV